MIKHKTKPHPRASANSVKRIALETRSAVRGAKEMYVLSAQGCQQNYTR